MNWKSTQLRRNSSFSSHPTRIKLPEDFHITLDGCDIRPSQNVKLLGVTLDRHLTFKDHIEQVCRKCHGLLGVLNRLAPFLSKELLRMAFISLIRSQLEYYSATFAPAARTHLQKLQTIQKIAPRIICRQPRNLHSETLLQSLRLDPLDERRATHTIALVRQMLADGCHPAVCEMFRQGEDGMIYNDNTSRLQLGKRRFSIFAKQLYNSSLWAIVLETRILKQAGYITFLPSSCHSSKRKLYLDLAQGQLTDTGA